MSKIVFCNNDITDIKYSGFTISKVYACGGQLVYDNSSPQPTPCQQVYLPTPFILNYNAKQYDSATHTIPMTSGQSNNIDCVLTGDVQNVVAYQDHISLVNTSNVKALVTGDGYFTTHCCITIVAKAVKPTNSIDSDLLVNRTSSNYNWMFRWTNNKVALHGARQANGVSVSSTQPNIVSVKAQGEDYAGYGTYALFKNHTTGEELVDDDFRFGSTAVTSGGTLFSEYADNDANSHFWKGDFYWIYMTNSILSDSQIQKVIEYNESCFGVMYRWAKADVSDYVCVGLDKHYKEYYQYSMDSGTTWNNVYPTSSRTSEDVIEYNSVDCGYIPPIPFKYKLTDNNSNVISAECSASSALNRNEVVSYSATSVSLEVGECTTDIGYNCFNAFNKLKSIVLLNNGGISSQVFYGCTSLKTVEIGSGVTSIGDYAFNLCQALESVTINVVTPFAITSQSGSPFAATNNTFIIYVPAESVQAYKTTRGWSDFASRIRAIQ